MPIKKLNCVPLVGGCEKGRSLTRNREVMTPNINEKKKATIISLIIIGPQTKSEKILIKR
jgi:hypothetical protein